MKVADKIIYLDQFFRKHKNYENVHVKELNNWFSNHPILKLADRNIFYDFRKSVLFHCDYVGNDVYSFSVEEIINFYSSIYKDAKEEKFWKGKK